MIAVPAHWTRGQLLDLKRFTDESYRATLLGEQWDPKLGNAVEFATRDEAQAFVSAWYARPHP